MNEGLARFRLGQVVRAAIERPGVDVEGERWYDEGDPRDRAWRARHHAAKLAGKVVASVAAGAITKLIGPGRTVEGEMPRTESAAKKPRLSASVAHEVTKVAKRVSRESNEKRFKDVVQTPVNLAQTASTGICLNPTAQGTAANGQRSGRKFNIESINIRGSVYGNTSSLANDLVRILVVKDTASRGENLNLTNVLVTNTANGNQNSHMNQDYDSAKRFKILWDKSIPVNATAAQSGAVWIPFNKTIKTKIPVTCFDVNNGTYADIDKNAIFIYAFCYNSANTAGWFFESRMTYRDV